MNRQQAVDRLMRGVGEDVRDYRVLCQLLEAQFEAALKLQARQLESLAHRIDTAVDALEQRRRERVGLVELVLGPGARMPALIAALGGTRRQVLATAWSTLEGLVHRGKQLNERNCHLIVEQHDIMQRVLHGEAQTYAPA